MSGEYLGRMRARVAYRLAVQGVGFPERKHRRPVCGFELERRGYCWRAPRGPFRTAKPVLLDLPPLCVRLD